MKIGSVSENQKIEKRISITPEIAKKYISLGFEIILSENYGDHLGIKDNEYEELGVNIQRDENEIIKSADLIVQLGLFSDNKKEILKENQTFIGVLDPYKNKEKYAGNLSNIKKTTKKMLETNKKIISQKSSTGYGIRRGGPFFNRFQPLLGQED